MTQRRTIWWRGAASLGLLAIPPAVKVRRRNHRRRARPADAVLAAWSEALDRLGEAGLARRSAERPRWSSPAGRAPTGPERRRRSGAWLTS